MSLFDYHGRFAKTQQDPNDTSEDHIGASDTETDGESGAMSADDFSDIAAGDSQAKTEDTSGAVDSTLEAVDEAADAVEASDDDIDGEDESADEDETEDSTEDVESSEDAADSDSAETELNDSKDDDVTDGDTDSKEDKAEDESLDEPDSDSNDSDASSSKEKPSKKKKTPASKGKHAAGSVAGSVAGGLAGGATDVVYALPTEEGMGNHAASPKRSRGVLKGLGIAACVIVLVGALVYGVGVLLFTNRILPNTTIGNHDISLYTNDEVVSLLESIENNYTIEVKMGTFSYKVTKAEIGLELDAPGIVEAIHERYDAVKWPLYILAPSHDTSDELHVRFDPAGYEQGFLEAVAEYNKTATLPTNASIYYNEEAHRYLVKGEVMGTAIDPATSLAALTTAISDLQPVLRLTEADLVQPTLRGNDEFIIESAKLANSLATSRISLVVNDEVVRDIGHEELSKSIQINDKSEVTFNQDALAELCSLVAKEFNTIGAERTYTRADGKVVTVKDGSYGWAVDEKALKDLLIEAIMTGESATVVVPFETTADIYVGPGQRDWGNRFIDVDLTEQHVRFYDENGNLFWETDCITGSPDGYHNTPQGVWSINDHMESPSKLVGYEGGQKIYESYVTYWMPFIKNSIGLHDATWQPGFGGNMYRNGYGSHGCVNISYSAARELWDLVRVGDVVVTHF